MDDNFTRFWVPHGGWEPARARAFRRARRAWSPDKLTDDNISETVDDVGLEIYARRHANPVGDPGAYLRSAVAKRLHTTYEQTLDPYERAALRAKKRAREGLARVSDHDDSRTDAGDDDDVGARLVRYDDDRIGEIADASGEDDIERVADLDALRGRLASAAAAVASWRRRTTGRTVATIADIATRALELLGTDPDALRVLFERDGLRLVVTTAMGDIRPERWGGRAPYELPSRASVSPVVWQELHGRYCERALDLLRWTLGGDVGSAWASA
jgi:hypothetical protein